MCRPCDGTVGNDPKRRQPGGDLGAQQRPEVPPVEAVGRIRVHEEDFASAEPITAVPDGQIAAVAVLRMGVAKTAVIDGDLVTRAADQSSFERHDMLEQWNATRQISARIEVVRKRRWRLNWPPNPRWLTCSTGCSR